MPSGIDATGFAPFVEYGKQYSGEFSADESYFFPGRHACGPDEADCRKSLRSIALTMSEMESPNDPEDYWLSPRCKENTRVKLLKKLLNWRSMSIKNDRWIREQVLKHRMIDPFSEEQVRDGVISYGLSSFGYDLRVSDEFKIFTNVNSAIIDPKAFDERSFVSLQAPSVIVPPNSFALARSIEYFRIPRDVLAICVGKSTYARCGIIVNVTPFEPEWEGFATLEISNTTPLPAKVYANEGLCQILFFRSDEACAVSYADRKGKYQKQQGIVLPKL
jgi:dCTP deaminase